MSKELMFIGVGTRWRKSELMEPLYDVKRLSINCANLHLLLA
jgi:hypothetical protein